MSQPKPVIRGLREDEQAAYLAFAAEQFGAATPQASAARFDWLLRCNPNARGCAEDLLVAVVGDQIVGCAQLMRLPWRLGDERFVAASGFNLMVAPEHRRGAGLALMLAVMDAAPFVLHGSTNAPSDAMHERLGNQRLEGIWQTKLISPVRGGCDAALRRLGWRHSQPAFRSLALRTGPFELQVLDAPDDDDLGAALAIPQPGALRLDWDVAAYRWRLFHPLGPRNALILARRDGRLVGRAAVSIGLRRGVVLGRLVDLACHESEVIGPLVWAAEAALRRGGAAAAAAVTTCVPAVEVLNARGWRRRKDEPTLRLSWQDKQAATTPGDLWGIAWDFGCDA